MHVSTLLRLAVTSEGCHPPSFLKLSIVTTKFVGVNPSSVDKVFLEYNSELSLHC